MSAGSTFMNKPGDKNDTINKSRNFLLNTCDMCDI